MSHCKLVPAPLSKIPLGWESHLIVCLQSVRLTILVYQGAGPYPNFFPDSCYMSSPCSTVLLLTTVPGPTDVSYHWEPYPVSAGFLNNWPPLCPQATAHTQELPPCQHLPSKGFFCLGTHLPMNLMVVPTAVVLAAVSPPAFGSPPLTSSSVHNLLSTF